MGDESCRLSPVCLRLSILRIASGGIGIQCFLLGKNTVVACGDVSSRLQPDMNLNIVNRHSYRRAAFAAVFSFRMEQVKLT